MHEDKLFTVIAINGSFMEAGNLDVSLMRFDNLAWDESVILARLSFKQGYEIVIWQMPEADNNEQTENAISEKAF